MQLQIRRQIFCSTTASPTRSTSTPHAASAASSVTPSLSVRPRSASTVAFPANAADPNRAPPKPRALLIRPVHQLHRHRRPPCIRSAKSVSTSSPAITPRHPSSHPPFGTESRWLPTTSARSLSPCSVTQRFPPHHRCAPPAAAFSFSSNHSRAFSHTGDHATRCAPNSSAVSARNSSRFATPALHPPSQHLTTNLAPNKERPPHYGQPPLFLYLYTLPLPLCLTCFPAAQSHSSAGTPPSAHSGHSHAPRQTPPASPACPCPSTGLIGHKRILRRDRRNRLMRKRKRLRQRRHGLILGRDALDRLHIHIRLHPAQAE
jgi:hypothetical protein